MSDTPSEPEGPEAGTPAAPTTPIDPYGAVAPATAGDPGLAPPGAPVGADGTTTPDELQTGPPSRRNLLVLGATVVLLVVGATTLVLGLASSSDARSELDDAEVAEAEARSALEEAEGDAESAEARLDGSTEEASAVLAVADEMLPAVDDLVAADQRIVELDGQLRDAVVAGDFGRYDAINAEIEAEIERANAAIDRLAGIVP